VSGRLIIEIQVGKHDFIAPNQKSDRRVAERRNENDGKSTALRPEMRFDSSEAHSLS
jgi:hypothetical protein